MGKMKKVIGAATVVVALGAASAASATTWSDSPVVTQKSSSVPGEFSLNPGTYFLSNTVSAAFGAANVVTTFNQIAYLLDAGNKVLLSSATATAPISAVPGTYIGNGSSLNNNADTTFTLASFTSGFKIVFENQGTIPTNVSFNSIKGTASVWQAVPGPIAGAGLPALLGLMGFAGFRRAKKAA